MAYTINSAKDSQGNEQEFLDAFNQNLPAIAAYKQANGGDLEGAFQAVTGTPWPSGRSVKMKGSQGEMTKDRTVKSVMGKYVLPIAAGVAAPFVLPALLGGGASAAGASGLMADVGATMAVPGTVGTAATLGTTAATTGGAGLLSTIGKKAAQYGGEKLLSTAGAALTGNAKQDAANRGVGLEAGDVQERIRQSGRQLDLGERDDAWKKLNQSAYVQQYGGYQPATLNMGSAGTNALPDFGIAPKASTPGQIAGADALQLKVLKRLQGGAPAPYTQDPKLLKPGLMEKIGNWTGPALTVAGDYIPRPRTT